MDNTDFAAAESGAGVISRRRVLGCCLAWPLVVATLAARAEGDRRVELILSDNSSAYIQVAEGFKAGLRPEYRVETVMLDELPIGSLAGLDREGTLLVPVGVRAAKAVAEFYGGKASVLVLLVPRTAFAALRWSVETGDKVSALHIDQPLARSVGLVRQLLPRARSLAAIVSTENGAVVQELRKIAEREKLDQQVAVVTDARELLRALPQALDKADVLLLLPDSRLINESSARAILLEAYRRKIPVVGFSRGLVNAGAVASVYSAPEQIGSEGAILAGQWNLGSGALPAPRFASQFSLAFNSQVARSLGIVLPKEEELRRQLQDGSDGR